MFITAVTVVESAVLVAIDVDKTFPPVMLHAYVTLPLPPTTLHDNLPDVCVEVLNNVGMGVGIDNVAINGK